MLRNTLSELLRLPKDERVELATTVLSEFENVKIDRFNGLLVEFAQSRNASAVLRGLRAVSDFEFEFQLAGMNRRLNPDIDTVFLTPSEQFLFISSSLIREISALGGDVSEFVHPVVSEALQARLGSKKKHG
jgi:pantetheine-phosphate adenylyltransferase